MLHEPYQSVKTPGLPSLQDRIRLALEEDLRSGKLLPGMAINEPALCARFGASRTPVREALLLLAAKGLVDIRPRSGIYVRQLEARELVAMMEGLAELEGVLARLAATRINAPLTARLAAALRHTEERAQADDANGYVQANAELHDVIYEASGNAFIVEQTQLVRLRIAPYRGRMFEKPGRLARSQAEHEAVVEAIQAGQGEAAAEAMRAHISMGGSAFADMVLGAPAMAPAYASRRPRKSPGSSD
ncbi:MAG: GntR family transcriptional regulator [Acidovorax soli]|uniref:GntR family transcriptional regulator n=1 Tax=Acidovorax soli TaxID=592050 RepID=UPI0026EA3D6D|nr:GntR family transcriptional regulator [Acidovorax soli]MCM2345742.1 GntR family transcriptional regulator [Acidovorax soli]